MVDLSSDEYTACIESQQREQGAWGGETKDDLDALAWRQVRVCVRRAGEALTYFNNLRARLAGTPTTHVRVHDRAPWRGTAWDTPDSMRAGLTRGECWPLLENEPAWRACVARTQEVETRQHFP